MTMTVLAAIDVLFNKDNTKEVIDAIDNLDIVGHSDLSDNYPEELIITLIKAYLERKPVYLLECRDTDCRCAMVNREQLELYAKGISQNWRIVEVWNNVDLRK